ncbi:MAG TPA: sigma-70 family RNA polymerase sigma factor [Polyangiaceae bacterium]|jgi:RNA polymerase sigma-70 factor (ECF subfamily)|nr:sigma-70 family RNA polymerase sigma factor [Polyangiaceae bacterium]
MSLATNIELPATAVEPAEGLDFARVYDEHVRFVWRTLRRLGVPHEDCDDALQDVFLIVHRKLGEFRPEAPVKHWLFRLAAGIARDHRRTRRRKDPRQHGLIPVPTDEEVADVRQQGPGEIAERTAAARLIRDLLQELEQPKREVFILADLEQMTAPEIAEVLELPLNTVYSRLRRARSEFEEALMRHRQREATETHHE